MASRFSLKRAPGFGYASFQTAAMIGRYGKLTLENTKERRKELADVARWVHAEHKKAERPLELAVQDFPEQSREQGGRPDAEVTVAIGFVTGRCDFRRGPEAITPHSPDLVGEVAEDEDFWAEAKQRLGIDLTTRDGDGEPVHESALLVVPAGVGISASYLVGVDTGKSPKPKPKKKGTARPPKNWKLQQWGKIFGYGLYTEHVTEVRYTKPAGKKLADTLRHIGQPYVWLECLAL